MKAINKFTQITVGSLLLLTSCATIMNGTTQSVAISSLPTNADIYIDNKPMGKSPIIVNLARDENHIIRIELAGYQPYEATLTHGMSKWVFGNLAFGGLIGIAVDAISGGLYKLSPDQITAQMQKGDVASVQTGDGDALYIAAVLEVDPSWEKIGSLKMS